MKPSKRVLRHRLARQTQLTRWANERADENERLWLEEHDKRAKFAEAHSDIKLSASHAIDAGNGSAFYCKKCSYQWPCPSFMWANGREFDALRLSVKKPEAAK